MKEISEACQIGRSSLYHYFTSVEEIFDEVLDKSMKNDNADENNVSDFHETLKTELINVDKKLYRAVVEHLLVNEVKSWI